MRILKSIVLILCLCLSVFIVSCSNAVRNAGKTEQAFSKKNINKYKDSDKKPVWVIGNDIIQKLNAGEFKDIEKYIDHLVVKKPYTVDGTRVLEGLYSFVGKRIDNSEMLDKWCAKDPSHHSAFILRGKYYIDEGWKHRGTGFSYTVTEEGRIKLNEYLELAKKDLEKAYAMNPEDPNSAASMISICTGLSLGEKEMDIWFKRAIDADPVTYKAYSKKQNFLRPKWYGTPEKDRAFAEYCYENAPPKSIIHEIMLDYIIENYRYTGNKAHYYSDPLIKKTVDDVTQRTLEIFPNSTSIRKKLAQIEADKGKYTNAVKLYSEILAIDPGNPEALRKRGSLYDRRLNKIDLAEADIRMSIESDPDGPDNYEVLARVERNNGNYQKAIEYYTRAIERKPKRYHLYLGRGYTKTRFLQDHTAALEDFRKAEKIDDRSIYTCIQIAYCLEKMKRFEEAKNYCRKGLAFIEANKPREGVFSISPAIAEDYKKRLNAMLRRLNGAPKQYSMKNTNTIPMDQRKIIPVLTSEILSQYTGTYKFNSDTNIIIRLLNRRLISQLTGQGVVGLVNESKMKFINSKLNTEVEFFKDDSGNITHLILKQDGIEKKADRVSDKVTDRYTVTLTADTLSQYEGTYKMGPRNLNITMENNYLFAQFTGQMKKVLFPESETVFFDNIIDTRLEFIKDESGKVSHLLFIQGSVPIRVPRKQGKEVSIPDNYRQTDKTAKPKAPAIKNTIYYYQHKLLPKWTFESNGTFFKDLMNGNLSQLKTAAEKMVSSEFSNGISVRAISKYNGVLITFQKPSIVPHCYYVFISEKDNKFKYVTYEKTMDFDNTGLKGVVGGWTPEGSHFNMGSLKYTDSESFLSDAIGIK